MLVNYKLEVLDSSKKQWDIQTHAFIGYDASCKIQIYDSTIAAKHAVIEIKNEKLYLKNLRESHTTLVNGTTIIEALLHDGDQIQIGTHCFVIHDLQKKPQAELLKSRYSPWSEQLRSIYNVAKTTHPVLLLGPSGTGKDIIAQSLHKNSMQFESPFVSVNCSALTETLIESELFGHIKGSFTGAIADRKGAFETARTGTLFLDEIGDLPYTLQAKLLRALENSEIRPVGSDKTIKTNVRIISATHQNLYAKIREGSFRTDLFYRLNVITVEVPSLKERIEDFEDLIYLFAKQMRVRFSYDAIMKLKNHDWPGNIRELKNLVSRASALFPKESIEVRHIDFLLNKRETINFGHENVIANGLDGPRLSVIKEFEKQMIVKRLSLNRGNQKKTAQELGMPKSTLHDRIKFYNISINQLR